MKLRVRAHNGFTKCCPASTSTIVQASGSPQVNPSGLLPEQGRPVDTTEFMMLSVPPSICCALLRPRNKGTSTYLLTATSVHLRHIPYDWLTKKVRMKVVRVMWIFQILRTRQTLHDNRRRKGQGKKRVAAGVVVGDNFATGTYSRCSSG